ncbi:hypothetical protein [Roseococcus sp. YIM B11640]|uniref:hypothetical protein n=1 Tax=Roseococcus sp. YIM B11640 TaxID=3133973 RepID=UPI003C7A3F9B
MIYFLGFTTTPTREGGLPATSYSVTLQGTRQYQSVHVSLRLPSRRLMQQPSLPPLAGHPRESRKRAWAGGRS